MFVKNFQKQDMMTIFVRNSDNVAKRLCLIQLDWYSKINKSKEGNYYLQLLNKGLKGHKQFHGLN